MVDEVDRADQEVEHDLARALRFAPLNPLTVKPISPDRNNEYAT